MAAFDQRDFESVLKMALPHAKAGNSWAQCTIALLYQCGLAVERNAVEAERWFLMAAEQNNPVAWNNLGSLYASKDPVLECRWSEARRCYERAKELGFNCAAPYPPHI